MARTPLRQNAPSSPRRRPAPNGDAVRSFADKSPVLTSLSSDLDSLEKQAAERLERLAPEVAGVVGALRGVVRIMGTTSGALAEYLKTQRHSLEASAGMVASERLKVMHLEPSEAERTKGAVGHEVLASAIERWAAKHTGSSAPKAAAERVLEALRKLEKAVSKQRLEALDIGADADALNLEDLLREQRVFEDLKTRPTAEVGQWFRALCKVDPEKARKHEASVLKLARERAEPAWLRENARKRPSREAEADYRDALSLRNEIEALRKLRQAPDVEVFEQEFRPQLIGLLRRTIGIDARELSRADFEEYARTFKPGAPLSELTLHSHFALRPALATLPPATKRMLPARLFAPATE